MSKIKVSFKVPYLETELKFSGELIKRGSVYSTIKYLNNNGIEIITQINNEKVCVV